VRIVTCSRVAVRGVQQSLAITDHVDFRHIVELTLSDPLRRLAYRQSGVSSDAMSSRESESLMIRRNYLRQKRAQADCRPFDWYMSNVATSDVVQPSADVEHFGKLRSAGSRGGLCLGNSADETGEQWTESLVLVPCSEHVYERQLLLEMTSRGALVRDGKCLEPKTADAAGAAPVAFVSCDRDSPRQRWWFVDSRLTPVTAPRKCLSAIRIASSEHGGRREHLAWLADCAKDGDQKEMLADQRWTFINF